MGGPNNHIESGRKLFGDLFGPGRYFHRDILRTYKIAHNVDTSIVLYTTAVI